LRAFLLRNTDAMTLHTIALGNEGTVGYQRLTEAALSVAAVRRFAPRFTSADIVRFVASVRASRIADGNEYDFDAIAAENILRYSLGQNVTRTTDPVERFRAVIALLGAFTDSELSSQVDLDDLLAQARTLADRWAANQRVLAGDFFISSAALWFCNNDYWAPMRVVTSDQLGFSVKSRATATSIRPVAATWTGSASRPPVALRRRRGAPACSGVRGRSRRPRKNRSLDGAIRSAVAQLPRTFRP
jgi:hypothetical protein